MGSLLIKAHSYDLLSGGVRIARGALSMTHLFFVGNCLLFVIPTCLSWVNSTISWVFMKKHPNSSSIEIKHHCILVEISVAQLKVFLLENTNLHSSSDIEKHLKLPSIVGS